MRRPDRVPGMARKLTPWTVRRPQIALDWPICTEAEEKITKGNLVLVGTRATVTCSDPGVPENGNRMNADGTDASYNQIFKEGRSLRFACRENIDVYGMTLITCRSDGTWSGSPPMCNTPLVDTVCSLRVDGVGFFNCTRVPEGTSCDITCDGKLMGRFNCFDEDWFPRLPYCTSSKAIYRDQKEEEKRTKASCPDPETPEGAQRKDFARPPGSDRAVFTEGESVVFYCDEDGTFNHKRFFITCESDGTWSEPTGQVTRCNSTLEEEIKNKTCSDPGIPKGGNRMYTNGSDASHRRRFAVEESVVFDCKHRDLALQGTNLIACKSNGKWSAPLPRCNSCAGIRGKGHCADPGIPEGGGRRNTDGTDASRPRTFTEGESVMFYCKLELALEGPKHSTCRSDGTWSESLPKCNIESYDNSENVPCLDPGFPKGGNRLNTDGSNASYFREFQAGDTLMFSCNNDLALQGHSIITCRSNGTWSGIPPTCEICGKDTKKNQNEKQFTFGSCPHIKSPVSGTIFCQQEGSRR
ncbi:CUB and sushi domain-containing protein 3 [Araneus ventricosus]|uniref:CUB and sushi domain-containing protein 3 n=1 Tax=Araneus ventricosus TaxID=182803 RepID=A0A4Y2L293_ARAVE|nr:CUB and sushi domain-containing protein 3 [Araneus ventricosus]